jgi:Holliday junction DNA helicase RuvA
MISYLAGTIKSPNEKYFTILTNGGVGYKIFSTIKTLLSITENENIEMKIHTVVKDDAIDLYGFRHDNEMEMFEKLITVNGVGPKGALNILSMIDIETLANNIENGDIESIKISGIGKKTLEKIRVELKGKLSHLIKNNTGKDNSDEADARLALSSLGYNDKDISNAINEIKNKYKKENTENQNSEEKFSKLKVNQIIKEALKELR